MLQVLDLEPAGQQQPIGQSPVNVVRPVDEQYLPAGQFKHDDRAPCTVSPLYVPAGQGMGYDVPVGQYEPAGQTAPNQLARIVGLGIDALPLQQ